MQGHIALSANPAALASPPKENHLPFLAEAAIGVVLYLALYAVQRAESLLNKLRGRPDFPYDGW